MERRFIEEDFPINEVSVTSKKEETVREGHIRSMHKWWARRPLTASRAVIYSSLIGTNNKDFSKIKKIITNLSKWENSENSIVLNDARKEIKKFNQNKPPKILDPFSGGGSIPLESMRLGCDTYANDYNPIPYLILKSLLELCPLYASKDNLMDGLVSNLQKYGQWILAKSREELKEFFPLSENDESSGYLWCRTISCQNPKCGLDIPLLKSFWISKKKNIGIRPYHDGKKIKFEIKESFEKEENKKFNSMKGTISNAIVECLACGTKLEGKVTREIFQSQKISDTLIAIVLNKKSKYEHGFKAATEIDYQNFQNAKVFLEHKIKEMNESMLINPIPDEIIQTPNNQEYVSGGLLYNFTPVMHYGLTKWGDLFNERQKLTLLIFINNIKKAFKNMLDEKIDENYATALITLLALNLSNISRNFTSLTRFRNDTGSFEKIYARAALEMIFDYGEVNPIKSDSDWEKGIKSISKTIIHCSKVSPDPAKITLFSATNLPYDDNFFDAVITDPPYYDNIPYSVLSDFFYVILKRVIGEHYPELFSTPLTSKSNEIISDLPLLRGMNKNKAEEIISSIKTKNDFESMLSDSFKEIYRVLKPNGITVIVYAHKSTDGWETLINSLLDSGLVVTAAWPVRTELSSRLRSQESASLASSIYMVCRKWEKEPIGFYRDVKKELKQYLNKKLEQLWNEGISGADFFISAIGSAIEVFGKYEKVVDDSDNPISTLKLLQDTREIVTNYAINKVIKGDFSEEISQMTRFYILWRWAYGEAKVPFDDALKMAQSIGIDIEHEWNKGFIVKEKEFIRVLGPVGRINENLEESSDLIDILHHSIHLWKKEKREIVDNFLKKKNLEKSDVFRRVAQAISESLPLESTEKKWLDGFLTRFRSNAPQDEIQSKLF